MKAQKISHGKLIGNILGIAIATLLIVFAFCGRYAEGGFKNFGNFFLGTFGMAFYGLMAGVIAVCSFNLAGKSIRIPAKYATFFGILFVTVILFVHMLTTHFVVNYFDEDFASYAKMIYNYYDAPIGIPSFGGVFFGTVAWALERALTVWGASIVYVALLALCIYFIGAFFYAYACGEISLISKTKDTEPSETTSSIHPVSDFSESESSAQSDAMSILFENTTYPEVVSSTREDHFESAPQSELDTPVTDTTDAQSFLFGDDSEPPKPQNPPKNSFFRSGNPEPVKKDDDDIIEKDSVFSPFEQTPRDWQATSPVKSTPTVPVEPVSEQDNSVDITEVMEEEEDTPFVTDSYASEEDVDDVITDTVVNDEPKPPVSESNVRVVTTETVINTPSGPMVQEGFDVVTEEDDTDEPEQGHVYSEYCNPPVELLNNAVETEDTEQDSRQKIADAIINKLAIYNVKVELADVVIGPTVTRFLFNVLSQRTRMVEFARYSDDIKACIEAKDDIRIEAPVKGTNLVGIEVANKVKRSVVLRSILESDTFKNSKGDLVFAIGQEISGRIIVADLADMPHLLIAGTTGSGKSVVLNCLICSLIYKYGPEYVRFVMVDPKFVELSRYNGLPHMLTSEAITKVGDALAALEFLIKEMESRYQLFLQKAVDNIANYNKKLGPNSGEKMPYLIFIVDELADLMAMSKNAFEQKLQLLAQKSRAAGIHIVLATQRPDVKTITGTIKANLPCRIALKVISNFDSSTILGHGGAEKLLGKGDMLFMSPSSANIERIQGAYISNDEIRALVDYTRQSNEAYFDEKVSDEIFQSRKPVEDTSADESNGDSGNKETQLDPLCKKALRFWLEKNGGRASIASIQRNLGIGFNRAGRIMDSLQQLGYVESPSASDTSGKQLNVLVTLEELDDLFPNSKD